MDRSKGMCLSGSRHPPCGLNVEADALAVGQDRPQKKP